MWQREWTLAGDVGKSVSLAAYRIRFGVTVLNDRTGAIACRQRTRTDNKCQLMPGTPKNSGRVWSPKSILRSDSQN